VFGWFRRNDGLCNRGTLSQPYDAPYKEEGAETPSLYKSEERGGTGGWALGIEWVGEGAVQLVDGDGLAEPVKEDEENLDKDDNGH
jgi:hypothetical protein